MPFTEGADFEPIEIKPVDVELPIPVVSPTIRTGAYLVGAFAAGVAIFGLAIGNPVVVAAGTALSGTANAIAFGYRPTR
jgi:hypothetical protein